METKIKNLLDTLTLDELETYVRNRSDVAYVRIQTIEGLAEDLTFQFDSELDGFEPADPVKFWADVLEAEYLDTNPNPNYVGKKFAFKNTAEYFYRDLDACLWEMAGEVWEGKIQQHFEDMTEYFDMVIRNQKLEGLLK